jgi:chemotaxis protein CheD
MENHTGLRQIFLRPGELAVCAEPCLVTTLLGSCVAVTLYCARLNIGGICHALLPQPGAWQTLSETMAEPYRYVSLAIPTMLKTLGDYRVAVEELEVKLFGGANVFAQHTEAEPSNGIGHSNVACARQWLASSRLTIKRSHTGGVFGRKLRFNTATGEVWLKQLQKGRSS